MKPRSSSAARLHALQSALAADDWKQRLLGSLPSDPKALVLGASTNVVDITCLVALSERYVRYTPDLTPQDIETLIGHAGSGVEMLGHLGEMVLARNLAARAFDQLLAERFPGFDAMSPDSAAITYFQYLSANWDMLDSNQPMPGDLVASILEDLVRHCDSANTIIDPTYLLHACVSLREGLTPLRYLIESVGFNVDSQAAESEPTPLAYAFCHRWCIPVCEYLLDVGANRRLALETTSAPKAAREMLAIIERDSVAARAHGVVQTRPSRKSSL